MLNLRYHKQQVEVCALCHTEDPELQRACHHCFAVHETGVHKIVGTQANAALGYE